MFGIGHWELMAVMFVALLIFGSRLPRVAKDLARSLHSFKQGLKEAEIGAELDAVNPDEPT